MDKETNKDVDGNMSLEDAIKWQDTLKKGIDFNKPDDQLTPTELVNKVLYQALDKQLEETLEPQTKKDIDQARLRMESLDKFQDDWTRLIELGREIEKNLFWQYSYITIHFDKTEQNHYYVVTRKMTDDAVKDKSLSNYDRIELANKILGITENYRKMIKKEITTRHEMISALLPSVEKIFNEIDFDLIDREKIEGFDGKRIRSQFKEWIELTKQLLGYRKNASTALYEDIDLDEIIPEGIIKNEGDINKPVGSGAMLATKGLNVTELIKEADKFETEIGERRSKICLELFGNPEDYVRISKETTQESAGPSTKTKSGMGTKWTVVIVLTIIALSGGIWTAIGVFILGSIIINLIYGNK